MKSDRDGPVAIIGGGASGTILAAQLSRRGIQSVMIEGGGRAGKGREEAFHEIRPAEQPVPEALQAADPLPPHGRIQAAAEVGAREMAQVVAVAAEHALRQLGEARAFPAVLARHRHGRFRLGQPHR